MKNMKKKVNFIVLIVVVIIQELKKIMENVVCYENTLTKVDCCKGFICFKCWSNIKPKNKA
jgi:hypothetical protein